MKKPWKTFRVKTKPKLSCLLIGPHHFPSLPSLPVNGSKQQRHHHARVSASLLACYWCRFSCLFLDFPSERWCHRQCHMTCCPAHILQPDRQKSNAAANYLRISPTHFKKCTCFVVTSYWFKIPFPPAPAEKPENTRTVPCPRYFCCEASTVTVSIVTKLEFFWHFSCILQSWYLFASGVKCVCVCYSCVLCSWGAPAAVTCTVWAKKDQQLFCNWTPFGQSFGPFYF